MMGSNPVVINNKMRKCATKLLKKERILVTSRFQITIKSESRLNKLRTELDLGSSLRLQSRVETLMSPITR